jgi:hypothetical protein
MAEKLKDNYSMPREYNQIVFKKKPERGSYFPNEM